MSSSVSSASLFSITSASSSAHTTPPKLPLRSALRSKTSTSTITGEPAAEKRPMATALLSLAPTGAPPPSSPKQSYFDKYPVRNQKSKERLAEATSSSRAQTARERARALSAHYDSLGSESEPSPRPSQAEAQQDAKETEASPPYTFPSYAFPSFDDAPATTTDEDPGASAPAITPRATSKNPFRPRQTSTTSSKSRTRSKTKALRTHSPERISPPITTTLSSPLDAYPLSPLSSDPPFYSRTSISSSSRSRTQTTSTFAEQDPERDDSFTLATPQSSIYRYRADKVSVMVAAPTSNNGVETMDALVNQMNGGHNDEDMFQSILNTGRRLSVAPVREKEKRRNMGTLGKMRHHPLYHPPLPEPPKGVKLGLSPNRDQKSDETDSEMSTVEKERTKRWTAKQQLPPRLPPKDMSTRSDIRPTSSHRSHSDGTVKSMSMKRAGGGSTTDLGGESSSSNRHHLLHHRKRSSVASSRPGSRDQTSSRPNSRDKSSARPTSRDKDSIPSELRIPSRLRERERPPRSKKPSYDGDSELRSDSASASPSLNTSAAPSPVVEQAPPPPPPVVVPSIDEIIRKNAPSLITWASSFQRNNPNDPSPASPSEPSNSPAVPFPTSSSAAQAPRQRRTARLAPPPSSYVPTASAPLTPISSSSTNTDDEDETALSSADSIAAEARRGLKKRIALPPAPANGVLRRGTSEDGAGSIGKRSLQHARSFGGDSARAGTPETVGAGSEPHVVRRPFLTRVPKSDGAAGVPGSSWSGPSGSIAPSTPDSNGTFPASLGLSSGQYTPGLGTSGFGQQQQGQDPVKHELAQFLRSPRLTRLLTLRRQPHAGLTVSMADVGSPTGHPVIVYLGLGCVRYLIALYDEMAEALNLRLVCVDRWGLGRTGEPKDSSGRGLLEWASVIEEVADELGLERFSVVAHSAGAPYALAGRSSGSLSTSEYDDLADFKGKYGSSSTLADANATAPVTGSVSAVKSKKKPVGKKMLSLFNGNTSPGGNNGNTNDPSAARTSRTNSLSSSVATLPAKSPKLKGLKSLSSLKNEAALMAIPQDTIRRTSEPTTPSQLSQIADLASSIAAEGASAGISAVMLPAHVGLGIGLDEEMLQWSSRLQMLEELEQPGATASAPAGLKMQGSTLPRASMATSRSSGEGRRSFGRAFSAGSPLATIPPVPPLPSCNPRDMATSPIPGSSGKGGAGTPRSKPGMSLTNALLRASHAESLKGGTADLLAILERDSKPWGFSYADVKQRVKVWYGDRDEKIAIGSVHWMERVMKDCTVQIVKGGTHNLMTNADVVVEVLESIAKDWTALGASSSRSGGAGSASGGGTFSPSHGPSGSISSFSRRRGRV
ncbi:hypothetical protein FRB97_006641 [Tulasnella sp. 331]|nr:hypothetical protein FRB97_006641 [Tulasnella sp. 331]